MKNWMSGLLAGLLLTALLAGCSKTPAPEGDDSSGQALITLPSGAESAAPTEPPVKEEHRNPLTGEYDLLEGGTRPVAVMIGNNSKSRPQLGIDKADLFVEAETEGGITRIMAVFANAGRIPDKLGSVRSARSPFVSIAQGMDLIYAHAGGSDPAMATLNKINIDHINALAYDGTTFWRDKQLWQDKGQEYSMLVSGEKMKARTDKLKFSAAATRPAPFSFGEKAGGGPGAGLQVNVSDGRRVTFVYDAATGLYTKGNGTLGDTTPHKAADGGVIKAANVLVMYAEKYMENSLTCNFKTASGSGLLVSGGTSRPVKYVCTKDQFAFQEEDGSALTVAPGKTYICLVNSKLKSKTVLE